MFGSASGGTGLGGVMLSESSLEVEALGDMSAEESRNFLGRVLGEGFNLGIRIVYTSEKNE